MDISEISMDILTKISINENLKKKLCNSWKYFIEFDDAFSIGTGLERAGFVEPIR